MKNQRLLVFSMAMLLGVSAFFLVSGSEPAPESSPAFQKKRIEVATVRFQDLQRSLPFSGTLRAANRADLTFTLGGRMVSRSVQLGDRVTRGQVIARLDQAPLRHARQAAAATLAEIEARQQQAGRDLARVGALEAAKAATREELEQARAGMEVASAGVQAAKTALDEAERQLKEAVIRAPYDGRVTEVYLEAGEFASPGVPIIQLAGSGALELEVEVPEKVLGQCQPGQEVAVTLPFSDNRRLTGRIRGITPSSGSPGRLFPVVITLAPNPDLYPGMTARLTLTLPQPNSMLVPVSAVLNPGGSQPMVFKVANNRVEKVAVTLGELIGEWVAVEGALEASDQVAISGFYGLLSGDEVEVLP